MNNIILTGFMGTGKSSVGRDLARELNYTFIDTDAVIEKETGLSIFKIFEKEGEAYFRTLEKRVIYNLLQIKGHVVTTGGGAVVDEENLNVMKRAGLVVCLTASVDAIISRVDRNSDRPLLNQHDKRKAVMELLEYRKPFYAKADICVDTTDKTIKDVVEEIREKIRLREDKWNKSL